MLVILNQENYDNVFRNENYVLFFSATWCGPCKAITPLVSDETVTGGDKLIIKIDIDNYDKLTEQWNITKIPTLVAVSRGQETQRLTGADKHKLKNFFDSVNTNTPDDF